MNERYKVLGAMIALDEFTVEDIAKRTGVKSNTINTVVNRHRAFLDEIGHEETGRRGGKPKKYCIKPQSASVLHSELEDLYRHFPGSANLQAQSAQQRQKIAGLPLGLVAAENSLLQRYPKANDWKEKQRILNLAKLDYQKGSFDGERVFASSSDGEIRQAIGDSLQRIRSLQTFCELDLLANSGKELEASILQARLATLAPQISVAIGNLQSAFSSTPQVSAAMARPASHSLRPDSQHYIEAKELLDRIFIDERRHNTAERSELLEKANAAIARMRDDNQKGETPQVTLAFLQYEQARLKFLMSDFGPAKELFGQARQVFSSSSDYTDEIAKIDQHLAVLAVSENPGSSSGVWMEVADILGALNKVDDKSQSNYPLAAYLQGLLARAIHEFSETERKLKEENNKLRRSTQRPLGTIRRFRPVPEPGYVQLEPNYLSFPYLKDPAPTARNMVRVSAYDAVGQQPEDEVRTAVALSSQHRRSRFPHGYRPRRRSSIK